MWKTVHENRPRHFFNKLTITDDCKIVETVPRLKIVERSYKYRTISEWNGMTDELRHNESISSFKKSLKTWIKSNRPLIPGPGPGPGPPPPGPPPGHPPPGPPPPGPPHGLVPTGQSDTS